MQVRRPKRPIPRSPEYDYDEYDTPYLGHGNVGWNDHVEGRKRAYPERKRPFPTGFSNHESVARKE